MTKFSDLRLNPKVLKAIEEAGYDSPTPIQAGAIPAALEGRDVLGIAQTGTGKTAAFTMPMITMLARGRVGPFAGRALAGLGAFQPDEHRSAGRVACVADQPVAALAASGGKVMAADRFRLTAETLREV